MWCASMTIVPIEPFHLYDSTWAKMLPGANARHVHMVQIWSYGTSDKGRYHSC